MNKVTLKKQENILNQRANQPRIEAEKKVRLERRKVAWEMRRDGYLYKDIGKKLNICMNNARKKVERYDRYLSFLSNQPILENTQNPPVMEKEKRNIKFDFNLVSYRTMKVLKENKLYTLGDLADLRRSDLLCLPRLGKVSVKELINVLISNYGIELAP